MTAMVRPRRLMAAKLAGAPLVAAMSISDLPWGIWAGVIAAILLYSLCGLFLAYKVGVRALDKVDSAEVPSVVATLFGGDER
ncbi:hypothetical protein J5X84_30835 [Streptosporangiaceae bacterium NEAU-GS5]|nr:hypothetical protein [Streptosporangiaceae bacterium NEAU-GS5]